jgi:23S rRNA (cytidine1920-2'-O)/16S rRNA (cytidine1409-2'-O)-methyltransferase
MCEEPLRARAALFFGRAFSARIWGERVFNTTVENSVEKYASTLLSGSVDRWFSILHRGEGWHFRGVLENAAMANRTMAIRHSKLGKPSGLEPKLKLRLDKLLVDRALAASRERAQALIIAGKVLVNDQKVDKAGAQVVADATVRLLGEDLKYVSRGGLKLERALEHWRIEVEGKSCLDVGASTGGFTDCLLQHGAARVIAVDTGYGQMDFRLRQDARVRLLEKTNARYVTEEVIAEKVDLIVVDVAFISATLVLPPVVAAGFPRPPDERRGRQMIVLVKPQFEAGRELVGKGGIVRDEMVQLAAVERVKKTLRDLDCTRTEVIESPILGAEGNREFLLRAIF